MTRDNRGYTIAELVIVMMIFSVVMALISLSFSNIVKNSSVIVKSVETDIGGLIGLELLRSDLEAAGFGLPWSLPDGVTYHETLLGEMVKDYPGTAASSYNDSPPSAPMAYQAGNQAGYNASDYLVLKGTAVGMSRTSRRWGYLNYSSSQIIVGKSKSGMDLLPDKGEPERVVVLKSAVDSGHVTRQLVTAAPNSTAFTLVYDDTIESGFLPKSRLDSYLVYGVAAYDEDNPNALLAYPYNRADYYIKPVPSQGGNCAPNTGTLLKTTIDHNGRHTQYPLLDCVADFQVLFHVADEEGSGILTAFEDDQGRTPPKIRRDAAYVRNSLKEVRIYVMAQQGKLDPGYDFPMPGAGTVISVGDRGWTRPEFLRNGWEHYHWKVYTIVVQPKNL